MDASLFDQGCTPCAGGVHTAHQAANAALKTSRYHALTQWTAALGYTRGRGIDASLRDALPAASSVIDLTDHETIPVAPWKYIDKRETHMASGKATLSIGLGGLTSPRWISG